MLLELYIENFVLIDKLTIPFDKGFNVLTGETGAGKSILLGALDLILGGKFNKDSIKDSDKKAVIQGTFSVDELAETVLHQHGVDSDEGLVMLSREMYASGRSILRINGRMVPKSIVSAFGNIIVDIHGQHEHQSLLRSASHIKMLDMYADQALGQLLADVHDSYKRIAAIKSELDKIDLTPEQVQRELELVRYQLDEIQKAALEDGEDDAVEARLSYLKNFEQIHTVMNGAHEAISDEHGIYSELSRLLRSLTSIEAYDEQIKTLREELETVYYSVENLNSEIREYAEGVEYSPEVLQEVEERFNAINDLKRKYGQSITEILEYADNLESRLNELTNHSDHVEKLKSALAQEENSFDALAKKLTEKRTEAAKAFDKSIMKELFELNMKDARFNTSITPSQERRMDGMDSVEFLISTNLGQALRPLRKVVSGGELSRIMLSIKLILGKLDEMPTLVFDEVDTGISGITASIVGEKLQKIADTHQVLCVTHLPQIAVMADQHLFIEKHTEAQNTVSSVKPLDYDSRILEIGRLIGGDVITDTTRVHAIELIEQAHKKKMSS
jgi:DNA repair protein RecN (Recombination protein N)